MRRDSRPTLRTLFLIFLTIAAIGTLAADCDGNGGGGGTATDTPTVIVPPSPQPRAAFVFPPTTTPQP